MARLEAMNGNMLTEKGPKWPVAIMQYPKSYLGKPKEWGKDFPPAITVSHRVRIGSLPHGKELVK